MIDSAMSAEECAVIRHACPVVADHGVVTGDTVTGTASAAQEVFDKLDAVGIDLTDVFIVLENEGVEKFEASWKELLDETEKQLHSADK